MPAGIAYNYWTQSESEKRNHMIRLLYLSQATNLSSMHVDSILETSRRNNPQQSITGVLVVGGGWIMQLLEGPEAAVIRLYSKILDDSRHSNVRIIHITPAAEKIFGDWSMGFVRRNPLEFEHVASLRERRLETVNASMFAETLREFATRLRDS